MRDIKISDALREFFWVEIRNEKEGGVSPATLASALDSLEGTEDNVIAEWCGEADSIHYGTQGDVRFDAIEGVKQLIKEHGLKASLQALLHGDETPGPEFVIVPLYNDGKPGEVALFEDAPGIEKVLQDFEEVDRAYCKDKAEYHGGFSSFMEQRGFKPLNFRVRQLED